jgi:creatinine amidohydrolase/Fe(II)-dependent formamide hydrolase-like protein
MQEAYTMALKRLDQMTLAEAEQRMAQTDLAFFPQGPTEGHGLHMPLGCDYYVATAAAMLLAERSGGICLPPLPYNYAGGTASFAGTIQVPPTVQAEMTKAVVRELWHKGFRRIILTSIHGPNTWVVGATMRELYEYEHIPTLLVNPYTTVDDAAWAARIPNYDGAFKEACMSYAAMKVMGMEALIPDPTALRDENPSIEAGTTRPEVVEQVGAYGVIGAHYTHHLQHQPPRAGLSVELGMEMLEEAVQKLLPAAEALGAYVAHLEEQGMLAERDAKRAKA